MGDLQHFRALMLAHLLSAFAQQQAATAQPHTPTATQQTPLHTCCTSSGACLEGSLLHTRATWSEHAVTTSPLGRKATSHRLPGCSIVCVRQTRGGGGGAREQCAQRDAHVCVRACVHEVQRWQMQLLLRFTGHCS